MSDFRLCDSNLEENLEDPGSHNVLQVAVTLEQIVICLCRAYEMFHHPLPDFESPRMYYLPFFQFKWGDNVTTFPAAGLPYRLLQTYQFRMPAPDNSIANQPDFRVIQPELTLENALSRAGCPFSDHPLETAVGVYLVPFYIVNTQRGKTWVPVLINAYNGDVLLDHPPVLQNKREGVKIFTTAVIAFLSLVSVVTVVWSISGSMALSFAVTVLLAAGVRRLLIGRFSD